MEKAFADASYQKRVVDQKRDHQIYQNNLKVVEKQIEKIRKNPQKYQRKIIKLAKKQSRVRFRLATLVNSQTWFGFTLVLCPIPKSQFRRKMLEKINQKYLTELKHFLDHSCASFQVEPDPEICNYFNLYVVFDQPFSTQ